MGLSSKLFYQENKEKETLFQRVTLSDEQLEDARLKKNELLSELKSGLASNLEVVVRHWLQGSYKNHTLIRPVQKKDEFDIDVGIYLLCDAMDENITANDAKSANRDVLAEYASGNSGIQLQDSKNACERISFKENFHIDVPIYYLDVNSNTCKLATQEGEWIDSDPKALQDWFNLQVNELSRAQLSQLRRVIKYLKTWTALKSKNGSTPIPSIVFTVLVAELFSPEGEDDDAFIIMVGILNEYLQLNDFVPSPINGDDLLGFDSDKLKDLRSQLEELKNYCENIKESDSNFQQYLNWLEIFEHIFPVYSNEIVENSGITNLPATTNPPKIRVKHIDSSNNQLNISITEEITVYKNERLVFSIENQIDYVGNSKVKWMVRNQNKQAYELNDLGHKRILELTQTAEEICVYAGTHYMECTVLNHGQIIGFSTVKVNIQPYVRPQRNPPRNNIFKGY